MEHIAQSGPGGGGKRDDEGITKKPRIHRETSFVKRLDRDEVLMGVGGRGVKANGRQRDRKSVVF